MALSQNERDELGRFLSQLAMFYGAKDVDKPAISIYIDSLDRFYRKDFTTYIGALNSYQGDAKNIFFPTPATLRKYIFPILDSKQEANEVVSRIFEAIGKFGWSQPGHASEYMGEIAWSVVESHGGWLAVCENLGVNLSETTFRAQARDLAEVRIEARRKGIDRLSLGRSEKEQAAIAGIKQLTSMVKQIPGSQPAEVS